MVSKEEFGGLSRAAAQAMGFGRARALAARRRTEAGENLPGEEPLSEQEFYCDAEQVEIDEDGKVTKSRPASQTRPKK